MRCYPMRGSGLCVRTGNRIVRDQVDLVAKYTHCLQHANGTRQREWDGTLKNTEISQVPKPNSITSKQIITQVNEGQQAVYVTEKYTWMLINDLICHIVNYCH